MQCGACHIDCTPSSDKHSLLRGLLNRVEEKLIPIWLMQEQRLAQVQTNQSTGDVCQHGWLVDNINPAPPCQGLGI